MEGMSWNARTWLRKLAWYLHDESGDLSFEHALYPEQQFREELAKEQLRAERSGKALVLMLIDAEPMIGSTPRDVVESVGEEVTNCVRDTDICGQMKDGVLVGVILTEIEPEKIDKAQLAVAAKVRKKLRALLGEEMANRIPIRFHLFSVGNDGRAVDQEASDLLRSSSPASGWSRLSTAGAVEPEIAVRAYGSASRKQ